MLIITQKEQSGTGVQVLLLLIRMTIVTTMSTITGKTGVTEKPCKSGRNQSFDNTFTRDFSGVPSKLKKWPVTSSSSICSTSQSSPPPGTQLPKTQPARH